jgi:beta-glucanase (GH16 family)
MRTAPFMLGLAVAGCTDDAPPSAVDTSWELVWEDAFDGPAGSAPADHWVPDVGGDGWGNEQLEHNTDRTDNAFLDGDGHLVIRAQPEDYEGNAYTSARLTTSGTVEVGPARVEGRIKLPEGTGIWPAFWMLGADFEEVGWPTCGEIDILETKGEDPQTVITTVHGPGYSGGEGVGTSTVLPDTSSSEDFHTYAVDIDPEHLVWWIDGQRVHTVRVGDIPGGTAWAFDGPFFLILNVAVGGSFLSPPDASTPFPADMVVDYVRVYERAE